MVVGNFSISCMCYVDVIDNAKASNNISERDEYDYENFT